jgi:hypothetical protein
MQPIGPLKELSFLHIQEAALHFSRAVTTLMLRPARNEDIIMMLFMFIQNYAFHHQVFLANEIDTKHKFRVMISSDFEA